MFIQENAFEIVIWKMAAILSRPRCVKTDELMRHLSLKDFQMDIPYHSKPKV